VPTTASDRSKAQSCDHLRLDPIHRLINAQNPLGGIGQIKPALRLMTSYRLVIPEAEGAEVLPVFQLHPMARIRAIKRRESQQVYVEFNPRFERIWLEAKNASQSTWRRNRSAAERNKVARKHPGRQELSAELPRTEQIIACTPQQYVCGKCGQQTTFSVASVLGFLILFFAGHIHGQLHCC
jgi:hypothetical protein